jgi:hypothetical protein
MGLNIIIDRPILTVCNPHGFCDYFSAIGMLFYLLYKFDGVNVLALLVRSLKVLAGAERLAIFKVHDVSAVTRLRGDFPAKPVLFYCVAFRYHKSSFLPFVHFITPLCIYNSIQCKALSIGFCSILGKKLLNYGLFPIDNGLRRMVLYRAMNEIVQAKLTELKEKGWTLASIARELELSSVTVESWNTGIRSPANPKSVLESLDKLLNRKRIPKKKIYLFPNKA